VNKVAQSLACAWLAVALAGCGGHEGFISTPTALAVFREAGFTNLRVLSQRKAYEQLARRQGRPNPRAYAAKYAIDEDTIVPSIARGVPNLAFGPLLAVRLPSAKFAKKTYKQGYSPDALRAQIAEARRKYPEVLPRGFELAKLRTARVCNIVISSYNAKHDPMLDARLTRAIALLRRKC
jgi:hypothetical protein